MAEVPASFYTLHILDVATAWGFDLEGQRYQRIDLTDIRKIILGDRWEGEVKISGNTVRVATTRSGPADDSARAPFTIIAREALTSLRRSLMPSWHRTTFQPQSAHASPAAPR